MGGNKLFWTSEGKPINQRLIQRYGALAEKLFPIPRSITGPAIRQSVDLLFKNIEITEHKIASGKKIFDWEAPNEWRLVGAELRDQAGKVLLSSENSSLHVMNFSEPFQGWVARDELLAHLYTLPDQPDKIPYVTSYYSPRWGLCCSENLRAQLNDEKYFVSIDTEKYPGHLSYWTIDLPSTTPSENWFIVSSYLCHPSLGNNELSGPLVLRRLFELLSESSRTLNYRLVIGPETIGALAFLNEVSPQFLDSVSGGLVLTCLGGPEPKLSFKLSRRHWLNEPTTIDSVATDLSRYASDAFDTREYDPAEGSDERQYCAARPNLSVVQAARTIYGTYAEYHNSGDDLHFMNISKVLESAKSLHSFLRAFEYALLFPEVSVEGGEPFLSGRGLYPDINVGGMKDAKKHSTERMRVLSLCDGSLTTQQIWEKLRLNPIDVIGELEALQNANLVSFREV